MAEQVFVARERELAQLQGFLDRALSGQGQVCFVTGEAGAGKTALVTEFARRAQEAHADLVVATGNCNAQTGIGDPYLPFREVLELLTGDVEPKLAQGAITSENAKRLRAFSSRAAQVLIEVGPDLVGILVPGAHLLALLGKAVAGKFGWLDELEKAGHHKSGRAGAAMPAVEQSRVFEQTVSVLKALAAEKPLLVILDDLHWVDASSSELLFHLGRRVADSRILLVGTYRPEDVAQGRTGEQHPLESVTSEIKRYFGDVWVQLDQAPETTGRQFVDALLDSEPNLLGEDFRQALFRHTGGHPLFTIELLRDMQERADLLRDAEGRWTTGPALDWDTLPARVEGVIEKRIGRLEPELRGALNVASVEGETFTAQVVAKVLGVTERDLVRRLSQELDKQHRLVQEEGIERAGSQRLSRYRFRHKLFQTYLYDNLGETERELLHEDVGGALEALYGDQAEAIAVQLALHFDRAGLPEKAVPYLLLAGNQAIRISANREGIDHLDRGLELLTSLPETPERSRQELALLLALGPALMAARGYASPKVGEVYARARELCRQYGEPRQLFLAVWGLWLFQLTRAELITARDLGQELLDLAHQLQDEALVLEAHHALWATLFQLGDLARAQQHVEEGIALYDVDKHRAHAFLYGGHDPGVCCRVHRAWMLWMRGYPDRALLNAQEGLALAQRLSHPFSMAYGLIFAAMLHQFRREPQATQERAEAAIALAAELGFPHWVSAGMILRGWGLAAQGQTEQGILEMRRGWDEFQATGSEFLGPFLLAMLAEGYGNAAQAPEGLQVLTQALAAVEANEERMWESELHRLKGVLSQSQDPSGDAAAAESFRKAIEVARQQQAKSLELRATVGLCRLLQAQGQGEEGRQMLTEIYGWFTEGLDTPDLQDAKTLLAQLWLT